MILMIELVIRLILVIAFILIFLMISINSSYLIIIVIWIIDDHDCDYWLLWFTITVILVQLDWQWYALTRFNYVTIMKSVCLGPAEYTVRNDNPSAPLYSFGMRLYENIGKAFWNSFLFKFIISYHTKLFHLN